MDRGRSSSTSTTPRRLVWIVAVVSASVLLALGGAAIWRSARAPHRSADLEADLGSDSITIRANARTRDPVAYVKRFVGREDSASINELITIFTKWAAFPDALEARKQAALGILRHPDAAIAMEAILMAVDGDQTRREQDPLWRDLVKETAKLWNAVTFPMARNRLYIDERERPKALLLESFTEIRPDKLSSDQRIQLASDFIDLHPNMQPDQKAAVNGALTALGNKDVVEILAGRGLGENSHLSVVADRNRAIGEARAVRQTAAAQEPDQPPPPIPVQSPAAAAAAAAATAAR